jgi:hypothetical protein
MGAPVLPAEFQRRRVQCCSIEAVSHSRYGPTDRLVLPRTYNHRNQILKVPHKSRGIADGAAGACRWWSFGDFALLSVVLYNTHAPSMGLVPFPKGSWNRRTDGLTQARALSRTMAGKDAHPRWSRRPFFTLRKGQFSQAEDVETCKHPNRYRNSHAQSQVNASLFR